VPASQCKSVPSCAACRGPNEVCAGGIYGTNHCISVPDACMNNPTCACLGPTTCGGVLCVDRSGLPGIACVCPGC
jgi:hypothetical protein